MVVFAEDMLRKMGRSRARCAAIGEICEARAGQGRGVDLVYRYRMGRGRRTKESSARDLGLLAPLTTQKHQDDVQERAGQRWAERWAEVDGGASK